MRPGTTSLAPFARRVAELQRRHFVIALIAVLAGAGAFILPDADATLTLRITIAAACVGVAGWQVSLARKIGRGLAVLRESHESIVWVYLLRAYINGVPVASGIMLGLGNGQTHELPLASGADAEQQLAAVAGGLPLATIGYDAELERRFEADPRSLRRLSQ